MTVLKNPDGAATVEVAVEAAGVQEAEAPALTTLSIRPSEPRGLRLSTAGCFGVSIALGVVGMLLSNAGPLAILSGIVLTAAAVTFVFSILIALARALGGLVTIVQAIGTESELSFAWELARVVGNLAMAGFGMLLAYLGTIGFSRGRQLRRRGRVLLPALRENADWAVRGMTLEGEGVPEGLADQWRENGKTEHASVAAFARLTLDLMALGAPPRLIAAANQDSLDEIRHAELCFSLAAALDGTRWSPAPFPEAQRVATLPRARSFALAKLAVSSLVDGALHEGVSARIIASLAKRCAVPGIRDMLKKIAADEGRHAAHGWAVVEWCVAEGGSSVCGALLGAVRALPPQMRTNLPEPAAGGGWERWGIHGHALEGEEYGAAVPQLTQRVRALVSTSSRRAA